VHDRHRIAGEQRAFLEAVDVGLALAIEHPQLGREGAQAVRCTAMPKRVGWLAGIAPIARLPTIASSVAFGTGLAVSSHNGFDGGEARSSIHPATRARSKVAGNADRSCIESSTCSRRALRAWIAAGVINTWSAAGVRAIQNSGAK
jgi:hypothetical protein